MCDQTAVLVVGEASVFICMSTSEILCTHLQPVQGHVDLPEENLDLIDPLLGGADWRGYVDGAQVDMNVHVGTVGLKI